MTTETPTPCRVARSGTHPQYSRRITGRYRLRPEHRAPAVYGESVPRPYQCLPMEAWPAEAPARGVGTSPATQATPRGLVVECPPRSRAGGVDAVRHGDGVGRPARPAVCQQQGGRDDEREPRRVLRQVASGSEFPAGVQPSRLRAVWDGESLARAGAGLDGVPRLAGPGVRAVAEHRRRVRPTLTEAR